MAFGVALRTRLACLPSTFQFLSYELRQQSAQSAASPSKTRRSLPNASPLSPAALSALGPIHPSCDRMDSAKIPAILPIALLGALGHLPHHMRRNPPKLYPKHRGQRPTQLHHDQCLLEPRDMHLHPRLRSSKEHLGKRPGSLRPRTLSPCQPGTPARRGSSALISTPGLILLVECGRRNNLPGPRVPVQRSEFAAAGG